MDVGADVGVGVDADVMNNDVYSKRVDVNVAVDMNVAGMWVVCVANARARARVSACVRAYLILEIWRTAPTCPQ